MQKTKPRVARLATPRPTPRAQDPCLAMERGDASTRARPPDASSLGVTALNVGMIQADAFSGIAPRWARKGKQDEKLEVLAGHVLRWLQEGPAVVGLNEIAPSLVEKLVRKLEQRRLDVGIATSDSNSLLWRLSSLFT